MNLQLDPLLHSNVSPLYHSAVEVPDTDAVSNILVEQIGTLAEENEALNLVDHMRGNAPYPCHSVVVPHLESNDPCHGLLGGMKTISEALVHNQNSRNIRAADTRRRNRLRAAEANAAEAIDVSPVDEQLILDRQS